MHAEERQEKLERELKCMSHQRRVSRRTVAYRPVVSIRLSRSLGFPTCLFLVSLLSGPHERRPMASRKEQLSSSFFVAWTTQTLHKNLSLGFRRAKFTQRNTNLQKNIFVDDRLRGHHPRALKRERCTYFQITPMRFGWLGAGAVRSVSHMAAFCCQRNALVGERCPALNRSCLTNNKKTLTSSYCHFLFASHFLHCR